MGCDFLEVGYTGACDHRHFRRCPAVVCPRGRIGARSRFDDLNGVQAMSDKSLSKSTVEKPVRTLTTKRSAWKIRAVYAMAPPAFCD